MGRRQKVISDILGRAWKSQTLSVQPKSEPLSGGTDADVYRTETNTYNARDQITRVLAQQGTGGTGQETLMTYDGHGRLWTRKAPIQTSATFYAYNADDTVQSMTDARGATRTMSYNHRRLVTGVSYSAPSGITATGPTTFAYDAAGNRLWMDDDAGRVDYQYNALSLLSSETRQFAGLTGSYTLGYSYNLAGQVASVTDPTGVAVNYGYDGTGRLSQVTGSTYAGVSRYATEMQYRAFGALKSLTYGSNQGLAQGFDARLRLTSLQSGSQLSAAFQYYDDGQIRYAKDNTDATKDRAYGYDQMGRLSEGLTGGEARDYVFGTQGGEADGIYRQTYQYDVWDNLTGRTVNRFWSGGEPFADTYVNQRKQGMSYDDEGNITHDTYGLDGRSHTYDAAGQKVQTRERSQSQGPGTVAPPPPGEDTMSASPAGGGGVYTSIPEGGYYTTTTLTISQSYDGDGRSTKRVETKTQSTPFYVPVTTEQVDYYVSSSVLGGRVITELNSGGQKDKTNVYAGSELIAEQQLYYGGEQGLTWKQSNPVTGTEVAQNTANGLTSRAEYDPFGLELGHSDPYLDNAEPDYASLAGGSFYRSGGNPFDSRGGCEWNGVPMGDCRMLGFIARTQDMVGIGVREQGHEGGGFAMRYGLVRVHQATGNKSRIINEDGTPGPWGAEVIDPFSWMLAGTGYLQQSQNSEGPLTTQEREKMLRAIKHMLDSPDCGQFVKDLMKEAKSVTNREPNKGNLADVFSAIQDGSGGFYFRTLSLNGVSYSTVSGSLASKDASILIHSSMRWAYSSNWDPTVRYWAITPLHESFHLAGYDDEELAGAVYSMQSRQNPNLEEPDFVGMKPGSWERIVAASRYWGGVLRSHCAK
jgi:YD repeat-containing protein